jgi:hypothetical protein
VTIQAAVERADAILTGDQRPGHTELAEALTQAGLKASATTVRQARARARKRAETAGEHGAPGATVTMLHPHGTQSA